MDEKVRITFLRLKFLVSQCRKISWASPQCFRKLGYWKTLCIIGGITFSRGNFLVSQCRKNSWESLPFFRKVGVSEIVMHLWGITIFRRKNLSHSAEKFRKGILLFLRKLLVSQSFMDEKARITFLLLNILVSQCRKISWASPQCFEKNWGIEKIYAY